MSDDKTPQACTDCETYEEENEEQRKTIEGLENTVEELENRLIEVEGAWEDSLYEMDKSFRKAKK